MSKTIAISMTIPMPSGIVISDWPIDKVESHEIVEGDKSIRLWFDENCIENVVSPVAAYTVRRVPAVSKLHAEIKMTGLEEDFAKFLLMPVADKAFDFPRVEQFSRYNDEIYDLVFQKVNRLIACIRTTKGQYWLDEFKLDERKDFRVHPFGYAHVEELQARLIEEQKQVDWNPFRGPIQLSSSSDPGIETRGVSREQWSEMWEFLESEQRSDLVLELLAGSEELAAKGHSRASLTEAVTALETALSRFAQHPTPNLVEIKNVLNRTETTSLRKAVEHLGLTQSVRYLLPLIFPSSILTNELTRACDQALTQRHDVVHNGKRSVNRVQSHIGALRQLCIILADHTIMAS